MNPFDALHPALRYHIVNTLGWISLRSTQLDAIAPVLAGEDILLLAPTAGGKTEAALFPALSRMLNESWQGLGVLYVCPLRALLNNLEPRVARYAALVGREARLWHGDVGDPARRKILRSPPDILLTTPESLEAMLISTRVDHRALFSELRLIVIDELHAFASDDRGWHLLALIERLQRLAGRRIQRLALSATVGNPIRLLDWLRQGAPGRIVGPAYPPSEGDVTIDFVGSLDNAVAVLARMFRGERRLVFCDSRSRVEELARGLRARDVQTFLSHSSLSVDERRRAEAAFADERDCVIVATSTLELGLDVGDLDRVVQIDAPSSVSSFLQRMGRTGRRPGSSRNCLMLTTNHEALLIALGISRLCRDGFIESIEPPPIPAHIFAQQVLALSLQEGGIALGDWDRWLGDVLSDVDSTVRHGVIQHMLEHGILAVDGGVLGLGREGEAAFGRRHFQELVAAFTTPLLLGVRHGTVEVGTIDPLSIEGQPRSTPVILLGGRSWRVLDVDWPRRFVSVEPAAEEGRSRWLGSGRALHAEVARSVEGILSGVESGTSLSHRADSALTKLREDMPFVDGRTLPIVASGKDAIHVWSFAGGRANATIASGLSKENLRVRRADNFSISVASATLKDVSRALRSIDPAALEVPVPERVVTELKFGSCLPPGCARAVLSARLAAPAAIEAALQRPHHCFQTTS